VSEALHALIWLVALIPRAESPLPKTVDISSPFALAGAGGLIGGLIRPGATPARRYLLSRRWSLLGLAIGFLLYGFAVAHQLLFL
jgi:hypothetical protein